MKIIIYKILVPQIPWMWDIRYQFSDKNLFLTQITTQNEGGVSCDTDCSCDQEHFELVINFYFCVTS